MILFEAVLNASAVSHGNVELRRAHRHGAALGCSVAPDMHRVHHSVIPQETNSNFGFFLIVWDRLLPRACGSARRPAW